MTVQMMMKRSGGLQVPLSGRLVGLLPLGFFLSRLVEYVWVGTPSHILWNCHVANLMLALGLFFASPFLIRIAILWLILGVPPWVYDMFVIKIFTPVAFFSHVGGCAVAIWAASRAGISRHSWLAALLWHIVWQQITRLTTPAVYNVNVAHGPYTGFTQLFTAYWQYWLTVTALAALSLWMTQAAIRLLFPSPRSWEKREETAEDAEKTEFTERP